ncbi:leucyl/phenylalanyl-tRNA--protein transferase [Amorphus coralli]|uniref:leucyl/phenylalanyl-tRNA--protein transferase n=1 Tax=Amorphus coralli TaxID=340680 RepID=UPI000375C692|nr:leucyl/phenylalanyl-tRNA--protein transferase [Amorphus coralli]
MAEPQDVLFEITPHVLLKAYACGIFPMAESADDPGLFWIEPERRGVLPLDGFHLPRRLQRTVRQDKFTIRIDTALPQVIEGCATPGENRRRTWINARIHRLYTELHTLGHCHSVEAWQGDALVGGLYGVRLGGVFFGESMFTGARDASKVALVHLVARLRAGGFVLLDAQFLTDHLARFGALEISRRVYHTQLEAALPVDADFFALPRQASGAEALAALGQSI